MFTLLARGTQISHAEIATQITPFRDGASFATGAGANLADLALLNAEVTRQAATIAYLNDFWVMLWLALQAVPLLLLFRSPKRAAVARSVEVHSAAE